MEDLTKEMEALREENEKLSKTIKLLRKKLTRLRKREERLANEDQEEEAVAVIAEQVRKLEKEERCPKCNRKLIISDIGMGQLKVCEEKNCDYREVKKWERL